MLYFSAAASDLTVAFKLFESFRKGSHKLSMSGSNRVDADSVYISHTGGTVVLHVYRGRESAAVTLPYAHLNRFASFSLPYSDFLAFVKSTKAKGCVTYKDSIISADTGARLTVSPGPSLAESECGELQALISGGTEDTLSLLSAELNAAPVALPVSPLLTAARFTADDASKLVLSGVQFSGTECAGTNGHYLRRVPVWLPSSAGILPNSLWAPRWIASVLESVLKAKERTDAILYCFPKKQSLQTIRFSVPSVKGFALIRYADCDATYPNYGQLIPDKLPFRFEIDRRTFLDSVYSISGALKQSEGVRRISFNVVSTESILELSALIQKKANAKKYCSEYTDVGTSSAILSLPDTATLPQHPTESADWPTLNAGSKDKLREEYRKRTTFSFNVDYLKTSLESIDCDTVELSWSVSHTPFLLTGSNPMDVALIMPIQVRR